jgi:hypothetical protein
MEKYAAITSMDRKYYDHCGRSMLRSFKTNWSHLFNLYVYNEDEFEVKVKAVTPVGWDLGLEYDNFMSRHNNPRVKTFAKKGFTIIHAMDNIDCEKLIWLDGDTIIKAEVPMQLLELISPDDVLSTHFSVWHIKDDVSYHSCETGFFILNKKHKGYTDFCNTYKQIYYEDNIDGLRRFYDGEVYGKTVELMEAKGHKMLNLNPGKHKTPISRSVISPYLDHYKAGLKDQIDYSKLEKEYED